jgi:hypothetical protein
VLPVLKHDPAFSRAGRTQRRATSESIQGGHDDLFAPA